MKYDSIGFDLDGTLWSSIPAITIAWDEVAAEYNVTPPSEQDMMGVMGLNRIDLMNKLFPGMGDKDKEDFFVRATQRCEVILNRQGGILYDKLEATLSKLCKKYKLYIVSNCQEGYIESFLNYHRLNDYFLDFECAGTKNLTKAQLISGVLRRNNFKNSIYVGDTQGDYNAATEAGIDFVFAEYGFGRVDNCKYKVNCFENIIKIIEEI